MGAEVVAEGDAAASERTRTAGRSLVGAGVGRWVSVAGWAARRSAGLVTQRPGVAPEAKGAALELGSQATESTARLTPSGLIATTMTVTQPAASVAAISAWVGSDRSVK